MLLIQLAQRKKFAKGGGVEKWKSGRTVKFKTKKEANTRLDLMKDSNHTNFRNLSIGEEDNEYFVRFELKEVFAEGGEIKEGVVSSVDNGRYGEAYIKLDGGSDVLFIPKIIGQVWFGDKLTYKVVGKGYEKPTNESVQAGSVFFGHRGDVIEVVSINRKGVDVPFKKYKV